MKTCAKCFVTKPYTDFSKGARYRDGYQSYCKACMREYRQEKFSDPDAAKTERERVLRYYREDPDYRERFQQQNNARSRERWATDPAYRDRKNKQHYAGRFKPHRIEQTRLRSRMDRSKRRALEKSGPGVSPEIWLAICEAYNHRCCACGSDGPLEMDHVIPLSKGGTHSPENIQPLCVPCNRKKADKTIDYR